MVIDSVYGLQLFASWFWWWMIPATQCNLQHCSSPAYVLSMWNVDDAIVSRFRILMITIIVSVDFVVISAGVLYDSWHNRIVQDDFSGNIGDLYQGT